MKKNLRLPLLALALAFTVACGQEKTTAEASETAAQEAAGTTDSTETKANQQMAYVCPMECEGSASMQPGKCPVCGM
ncbi:MAG: heavy metal-binding domain-containing protein, partial [Rufibacter sp.]